MRSCIGFVTIVIAIITVSTCLARKSEPDFSQSCDQAVDRLKADAESAAGNVKTAVEDCVHVIRHRHTCFSAIQKVRSDIGTLKFDAQNATATCTGESTACVGDLGSLAESIVKAVADVASAVTSCERLDVIKCAEKIGETADELYHIVTSAHSAYDNCHTPLEQQQEEPNQWKNIQWLKSFAERKHREMKEKTPTGQKL